MSLTEGEDEDTEQVLRAFMQRELGFMDAANVEFQRVHRTGKRDGKSTDTHHISQI